MSNTLTPQEAHEKRVSEANAKTVEIQQSVGQQITDIPASSWHKRKMVAFDLETTGVDVETVRIVTASLVETYGDPFDPAKTVVREWIVNPGVDIPEISANVHGYTTERAQQEGMEPKTAVAEIISRLREEFQAGNAVVGFNVSFDFTILHREALRLGLDPIEDDEIIIVDPSVLDNRWDKYRKGKRRLIDIAPVYGIGEFDAHNSSADCIATVQIAYRMAEIYVREVQVPVETLMSQQRIWRKQWADDKNAFFVSIGRKSDFNQHMGVQPLPETEEES